MEPKFENIPHHTDQTEEVARRELVTEINKAYGIANGALLQGSMRIGRVEDEGSKIQGVMDQLLKGINTIKTKEELNQIMEKGFGVDWRRMESANPNPEDWEGVLGEPEGK